MSEPNTPASDQPEYRPLWPDEARNGDEYRHTDSMTGDWHIITDIKHLFRRHTMEFRRPIAAEKREERKKACCIEAETKMLEWCAKNDQAAFSQYQKWANAKISTLQQQAEETALSYSQLSEHIELLFRHENPTAHSTPELVDWARVEIDQLRKQLTEANACVSWLGAENEDLQKQLAEAHKDTRTCGEISCDECNERYQKAIAEISTLLESVAGWQRLIAALRGDVSGLEARVSWLIAENESLQKQFGVCSICGFIAWKSRETQPDVEDCQYCALQKQLAQEKEARETLQYKWDAETCSHCGYMRSPVAPCKCGQLVVRGVNDHLRIDRDNLREALEKAETLIRHLPCHCGNFGPNLKCPCCQAKAAIQQSEGN